MNIATCSLVLQCGGAASRATDSESPSVTNGGSADSANDAGGEPTVGGRSGEGGSESMLDALPAVESFQSCKALLAREPAVPSGFYFVTGGSSEEHFTYCDMDTEGGGWTRVSYPHDSDTWSASLIGAHGRQMLKCSIEGSEHVISPRFSRWSWTSRSFNLVSGKWIVNGHAIGCGANRHLAPQGCSTLFGIACGDGPDKANNFLPGMSALANDACADRSTVYTTGVFSVCGENRTDSYAGWVTFLREED
jgi:hypothetical protein